MLIFFLNLLLVTILLSGRTPSVVLFLFALLPSGLYVFWSGGKRSVFLADILAISFAHNAISMIKVDSFRTGTILLAGLFVYDVWWVFGTEVVCFVVIRIWETNKAL
jgi:minor histocompatibility antigen H13